MARSSSHQPYGTESDFVSTVLKQYASSRAKGHVHRTEGGLFLIDGIDYAGKGIGLHAIKWLLKEQGTPFFDVTAHEMRTNRYPEPRDWKKAKVIVTEEPSYATAGRHIREVLLNKENKGKFTPHHVATWYSNIDRKQKNARIVVPALEAGKIVVQGRSFSTTMVYQPTMDYYYRQEHPDAKMLTIEDILAMEGNRRAMQMLPDMIVIPAVSAEEAGQRKRSKDDNTYVEELDFQKIIQKLYESGEFKRFFQKRGVDFRTFPAATTKEKTAEDTVALFKEFLEGKGFRLKD